MSTMPIRMRRAGLLIASLVTAVLALTAGSRPSSSDAPVCAPGMDDATMQRWVRQFYARTPAHGASVLHVMANADTFVLTNFRFDTDGLATQIDTARITAGQTILFRRSAGTHTVTSGAPGDVNAGSLFDLPIDAGHLEQPVSFATTGTFPFHCRPHGSGFNMKGVVIVSPDPVSVPGGVIATRTGFVAAASPNPARSQAVLRFALARGSNASLRIFDVNGRIVASLLEGTLSAGEYSRSWDGRTQQGARAAAGVYLARLDADGTHSSTRIVLQR